jgi:hypothetical protein
MVFDHRLSFVHMAAHTGQQEYVFQEVLKNPELLHGNGELHLLLSAAFGGRKDLVQALLERGSSPMDYVACKWREGDDRGHETKAPIWMIVTGHIIGYYLYDRLKPPLSYEMWESFLDHEGVDASHCLFLMKEDHDRPVTHFITLKQFIRDRQPPNMDRLLALLDRGRGSSYVNGVRGFLSRYTPFFPETDSWLDKETVGLTRFHADGSQRMELAGAICGDLRVGGVRFRLF